MPASMVLRPPGSSSRSDSFTTLCLAPSLQQCEGKRCPSLCHLPQLLGMDARPHRAAKAVSMGIVTLARKCQKPVEKR